MIDRLDIAGPLGNTAVMFGTALAFCFIPNTWIAVGVALLFIVANGAGYAEGRVRV